MDLEALLTKLQYRVQRECDTSEVDTTHLLEMLDRARFEYSRYSPATKTFDFTLLDTETRVAILDGNGDPASVVSIVGVFLRDPVSSFPLGQGYGAPLDGGYLSQRSWSSFNESGPMPYDTREMPSILFTEAQYRGAYYRSVSYYRTENELIVVKPQNITDASGVIVYTAVRTWDEMPIQDERLLLDRALVEFIDDTLVKSQAGIVRIPTPHGSFEFDGGATLLSLRNHLLENFEGQLFNRLSHLSQG